MKKQAVVIALDDSCVSGCLITLHTLLKYSNNFNTELIVFEWGQLSEPNKDLIKQIYPNTSFRKVDESYYINNQEHDHLQRKWNYNCNYRFDIFGLEEYDKIVYTDVDILFKLDIQELLNYDVDFGACQMPNYTKYNQTLVSKVFNAGLLVVGKKFLNQETKKQLIEYSNTTPPKDEHTLSNKWFGNQPILNNYFHSSVSWLPIKYNTLTEDLVLGSTNLPINLHYVGTNKPWLTTNLEDSFCENVISSIYDKTEHTVLRKMILKKARQIVIDEISSLLKEHPKIPFFDFLRTETQLS